MTSLGAVGAYDTLIALTLGLLAGKAFSVDYTRYLRREIAVRDTALDLAQEEIDRLNDELTSPMHGALQRLAAENPETRPANVRRIKGTRGGAA